MQTCAASTSGSSGKPAGKHIQVAPDRRGILSAGLCALTAAGIGCSIAPSQSCSGSHSRAPARCFPQAHKVLQSAVEARLAAQLIQSSRPWLLQAYVAQTAMDCSRTPVQKGSQGGMALVGRRSHATASKCQQDGRRSLYPLQILEAQRWCSSAAVNKFPLACACQCIHS